MAKAVFKLDVERSLGERPLLLAALPFGMGIALASALGVTSFQIGILLVAAALFLAISGALFSPRFPALSFLATLLAFPLLGGGLFAFQSGSQDVTRQEELAQTPGVEAALSLAERASSKDSNGYSKKLPPDGGASDFQRTASSAHRSSLVWKSLHPEQPIPPALEAVVEGEVLDVPSFQNGKTSFLIQVDRLLSKEAGWQNLRLGVKAGAEGRLGIRKGDRLRGRIRMRELLPPQNPGGQDVRGRLAEEGVHFSGWVVRHQIVALGHPPVLWDIVQRHRELFSRVVESAIAPEEVRGLVRAMALGDGDGLARDGISTDFRASGMSHLLCVSGLHVGVVAFAAYRFLRWILCRGEFFASRWDCGAVASLGAIPLAWGYVLLCGAGVPAVRAGTMATMLFLSRAVGRGTDSVSSLSLAFLAILAASPRSLLSPSFQLSFAAVLGLMSLTGPIRSLLPDGCSPAEEGAGGLTGDPLSGPALDRTAGGVGDASFSDDDDEALFQGDPSEGAGEGSSGLDGARGSGGDFLRADGKTEDIIPHSTSSLSETPSFRPDRRSAPWLRASLRTASQALVQRQRALFVRLRCIAYMAWRNLLSVASSTLAATIATLPLGLHHFGQFSLVAIPANMAALSLGSLVAALSAIAAITLFVGEIPCALILSFTYLPAQLLCHVVKRFASLPCASGEMGEVSFWDVIGIHCAAASIAIALFRPFPARTSHRWSAAIAATALAALTLPHHLESPGGLFIRDCGFREKAEEGSHDGNSPSGGLPIMKPSLPLLTIHFFSIGQGDSFLIRFPDGSTMLVDGGGDLSQNGKEWRVGKSILLPALNALGVKRLDTILLTHPHPDHALGLLDVVQDTPVDELWMAEGQDCPAQTSVPPPEAEGPPFPGDEQGLSCLLIQQARRTNPELKVRRFSRGDQILRGGVAIRFLNPPGPLENIGIPSGNDGSLVFRMTFGQRSFLFVGDLESPGEKRLLEWAGEQGVPLASDVLKVGHHGSPTGTSSPFLHSVRPRHALISCGRGNLFGFPAKSVLDRLREQHTRIHRTDLDGAVTMETDGSCISIRKPFASAKDGLTDCAESQEVEDRQGRDGIGSSVIAPIPMPRGQCPLTFPSPRPGFISMPMGKDSWTTT